MLNDVHSHYPQGDLSEPLLDPVGTQPSSDPDESSNKSGGCCCVLL